MASFASSLNNNIKNFSMNFVFAFVATLFYVGVPDNGGIKVSEPTVISGDKPAGSAFFINDHLGNPVICWTEGEKENSQLYYAVYNKEAGVFGKPVKVTPSVGTTIHGESMNKVAFTKSGIAVAVYARKHPTETNKYAGSIFYSQSFDNGKSWTKEKYLHTDSLREYGRSYFDIATLPDGEVGATWLDGRMQLGTDGSSLYFCKTNGTKGFMPDKLIAETVCQCCRTDLYADLHGNVHILYRDIEASVKGQVRDFIQITSSDNGATFSSPHKVSDDNWIVAGCPHTGASMGGDKTSLGVVWFTGGGTPGLYYASSAIGSTSFLPRKLISENARHPQLAKWMDQSAIVWEEPAATQAHSEHQHEMHNSTPASGTIALLLLDGTGIKSKMTVDVEGGEFPVIMTVDSSEAMVAYTRNNQVIVRKVKR